MPDVADAVIAVAHAAGRNRSALLRDLNRRERTEVDAFHGAVAERVRAGGMKVPLCATLVA